MPRPRKQARTEGRETKTIRNFSNEDDSNDGEGTNSEGDTSLARSESEPESTATAIMLPELSAHRNEEARAVPSATLAPKRLKRHQEERKKPAHKDDDEFKRTETQPCNTDPACAPAEEEKDQDPVSDAWAHQNHATLNYDKPGEFDVVCGRGTSADRWPGNQHFRKIVAEYIDLYKNATDNRTKKAVTMEIVSRIKGFGRFLKEDEHTGRWEEVDDHTARSKVGQQLRYQMRLGADST